MKSRCCGKSRACFVVVAYQGIQGQSRPICLVELPFRNPVLLLSLQCVPMNIYLRTTCKERRSLASCSILLHTLLFNIDIACEK